MVKLGDRIKTLRRSRHLTQFELAEKLGIDQGAVSRWERGHINPSARYRQQIESVLEAPLMEMDRPLLASVDRDLHFSLLLDTKLFVLAASDKAVAVNGCRSKEELVGNCYTPLLDESLQQVFLWLKESGAFKNGISWAQMTLPTPTLHSGFCWMESMWIPFQLDSGELAYRISSRILEAAPAENFGRAVLEVNNQQRELLIPLQEHLITTNKQQSSSARSWSQAI